MKKLCHLLLFVSLAVHTFSQTAEWRRLPIEALPPDKRPSFHQLLCSSSGSVILSSTLGLIKFRGFRIDFPSVSIMAKEKVPMEKVKDPHTEDGIKMMCRGNGSIFFFLTAAGKLYCMDENLLAVTGWYNPPLYIPLSTTKEKNISAIWADDDGDLFVGLNGDSMLLFQGIANQLPADGEMDADGNFVSKALPKGIKKVSINGNSKVYKFTKDLTNPQSVLLATSSGLMRLNKKTGAIESIGQKWENEIIVTGMMQEKNGDIWFSTLHHGMGMYNAAQNNCFFYGKNNGLSINSFCKKSDTEFFIAVADSLPAIFNSTTKSFSFITDSVFALSNNNTTDIKVDGFGNLFAIKGGSLFYSQSYSSSRNFAGINLDTAAYAPFIYEMQINDRPYFEVARKAGMLHDMQEIRLKHDQNQLEFISSLLEFWNQRNTVMAWKLDGLNMDWVDLPAGGPDKFRARFIPPLQPGRYVFRVRAKTGNSDWRKREAALVIIISPPFWQTWWFWSIIGIIFIGGFTLIYRRHILSVKRKEREKVLHEKELLELEAKALRAQMNPHFVFNSLNSIKSLINKNDNEKAAGYLSTFSKLIRTLFQNSDKREVGLYEEIETCKLYTELEKMRFGNKVEFVFDIDETIDLKDVKVPALILQPFIENAIWHGVMPKDNGGKVIVSVKQKNDTIECTIDDSGIGRELSKKYKSTYETAHESKGIGLSQSRLELDKLLNEREDAIFIIDKEGEDGQPAGTKVIITFKNNHH